MKVLLIYTGGTIGMVQGPEGDLQPFDFAQVLSHVPELAQLQATVETWQPWEPMDSSEMQPHHWERLATGIFERRDRYSGFVVLHGTDTMAYTASALSFMLQNLGKPIVFTGSQLPIGVLRSDARENLITSLEVVLQEANGAPVLQEVAIYFEYQLLRANRAYKRSSQAFNAFESPNYPALGEAGVSLQLHETSLWRPTGPVCFAPATDTRVGVLRFFPGMDERLARSICLDAGRDILILQSFGSGNAPNWDWLPTLLDEGQERGICFINASQCPMGGVRQPAYAASRTLRHAGVLSAGDMTLEAVITKSMWLLGQGKQGVAFREGFTTNVAGERSL